MTTLRELVVSVGFNVNDAQFKKASGAVDSLKKGLMVVGAAAVSAAGSMFALAKSVSTKGDDIAKTSRAVGFSANTFQELSYAADLSGVSVDQMTTSMQFFSRNVGQAAQGNKAIQERFEKMGISIRDANGELKTNDQLLMETADSLKGIENPSERAAVSMELFGRSGLRMGTFLAEGSDAIAEMSKRAHESGAVMSDEALSASERFNDSLFELKATLGGLQKAFGEGLMNGISDVMDGLRQFIIENKELIKTNIKGFIEGVVTALKVLWDILSGIGSAFQTFAGWVGGTENALYILAGAFAAFKLAGFISTLQTVITVFRGIGVAALFANASVMAIPLAIAAIVAAVVYAGYKFYEWFVSSEERVEAFKAIWNSFVEFFKGIWDSIKNFAIAAIDFIGDKIKWLVDMVKSLFGFIGDLGGKVAGAVKSVTGGIGSSIKGFFGFGSKDKAESTAAAELSTSSDVIQKQMATTAAPTTSTKNVNVDSKVTVNVPPGTAEAQAQYVKDAARQSFKQEYERELQRALYENPELE
jgi:hypothetical protein